MTRKRLFNLDPSVADITQTPINIFLQASLQKMAHLRRDRWG